MKRIACLYVFMGFLLLCVTGCDKEEQTEEIIPEAIRNDFLKRYPSTYIAAFHDYSEDTQVIDFVDEAHNPASTYYIDQVWKMTYTRITDFEQLPERVRQTFESSAYRDAQIAEIFRIKRDGIEQPLYTLHFRYRWKKVEEVEHYVFLNGDGLFLGVFTYPPNDSRWFVKLNKDHSDFIANKYNGAEIRGYLNDGGSHRYFILHQGIVKSVFFRGEKAAESGFWKGTSYELKMDAKIPENVVRILKQRHPFFTYTNLYYIESQQGNTYLFVDKKSDNDLGYYVGEGIEPDNPESLLGKYEGAEKFISSFPNTVPANL